jgi:acyl dehydratase
MTALRFEDVTLGMKLPDIVKDIDQKVITRNAVASLDFNPIHTNPEWAKEVNLLGQGTTIAHGMCTFSFMASVITDWCYTKGGYIREIDSKFIAAVRPGDTITCRGIVAELHPRIRTEPFVVVKLTAENQQGELVAIANAKVVLSWESMAPCEHT